MEDRLKELKRELWSNVETAFNDEYVDYYLADKYCERAYEKAIDDVWAGIKKNETILLNDNGQTNYHEYAISIAKIKEIVNELKGERQGEII